MDTVLKALTRNRLSSSPDPDKTGTQNRLSSDPDPEEKGGDSETGRDRTLSSTSDYEQNGDNDEVIHPRGRTLSSTGDEDQLEDEEKKMNVSIDCTKALVIFGFSNWSELEPDEERSNDGYVEKRLDEVLEEKVSERREFRQIIEQFRYTNTELYQKMATAGESRSNALFNKKAKWKLALVLPTVGAPTSETTKPIQEGTKSPMIKAKPSKKSKFVKKGKVLIGKETEKNIEIGTVEDVMDENDEVIQSLKWAHDILLKETQKRKIIRAKKRSLKRRAHKKLQTLWMFHHQKDVTKKAKNKKIKEEIDSKNIYATMDKQEFNETEDKGALIDDIKMDQNDPDPVFDEDVARDEKAERRKTIIVNLQKRLSFKKASRFANGIRREEKTEEEKMKEAQKHLEWLQEKQKQNILVDFFGVPKSSKAKEDIIIVNDNDGLQPHEDSQAPNRTPALSRRGSHAPSRRGSLENETTSKPGQNKTTRKSGSTSGDNDKGLLSVPRINNVQLSPKKSKPQGIKNQSQQSKTPQVPLKSRAKQTGSLKRPFISKSVTNISNPQNKNASIPVLNITDDSMFKEQQLDTGIESDKPKQTPEELENIRKAKEEEEKYKKELEAKQKEERKLLDEKLTEEEREYAAQKEMEEQKRRKREENLEKILNFNFDADGDSVDDIEDLAELLSDSDDEDYEDEEEYDFSYRDE